jgi:hypothetical protein
VSRPYCTRGGSDAISSTPRPYDLHSAQIKKSDDLDNACAKSRVLEALLAQAVAMQIISAPEVVDIKRLHHLPLVGATLRELAVQDTLDSSCPHTTRMLSR